MPIVNGMTNLSQMTVKDLLKSVFKHMTSTQSQNAMLAANVMEEVNTSNVDTLANA